MTIMITFKIPVSTITIIDLLIAMSVVIDTCITIDTCISQFVGGVPFCRVPVTRVVSFRNDLQLVRVWGLGFRGLGV